MCDEPRPLEIYSTDELIEELRERCAACVVIAMSGLGNGGDSKGWCYQGRGYKLALIGAMQETMIDISNSDIKPNGEAPDPDDTSR